MPFEEINRWQSQASGQFFESDVIRYDRAEPLSFFVHWNLNDHPRAMSYVRVTLSIRSSLPYYLQYVLQERHEMRRNERLHYELSLPASIPNITGNYTVWIERESSWRHNTDVGLIELSVHKYVEQEPTQDPSLLDFHSS